MTMKPLKRTCARYPDGTRTEFWRDISWRVGDRHADRLCRFIDFYCRWFGLDPARFHGRGPTR